MTQHEQVTTVITRPVVISARPRRRRARHSQGMRDVDRVSRGLDHATYQMVNAIAEGMRTYLQDRDKSARRKRNGALVDLPINLAEALGTTLSEARHIPRDLARTV